jgi:hypothetical protein
MKSSTWTGVTDMDINIFSFLSDDGIASLILVDSYTHQICHQEEFYRQRIIRKFGTDIKSKDSYRRIYRNLSIKYHDKEKYSFSVADLDSPNMITYYAFMRGCECGYINLVLKFIERGLVKFRVFGDGVISTQSPGDCCIVIDEEYFSETIGNKQWEVLEILLDNGFKIEQFEWELKFILCTTGDQVGMEKWIKKGLNVKDPKPCCLRYATREGHNDMVRFLIKEGASIDIDNTDKTDWPPLVYAVRYCTLEIVKLLIDNGADVHYNKDMIFGTSPESSIWRYGGDSLIKPRLEIIDYLKTIR